MIFLNVYIIFIHINHILRKAQLFLKNNLTKVTQLEGNGGGNLIQSSTSLLFPIPEYSPKKTSG